ncbi:hypothetical protein [Nocardioides jishulii]|uniref:Uncharacterized protein n=1 Tax=Nocardioides jishulii TaxID=2575440 RepID=A0A4U2YTM3_9ACTN|nr:hypothetical protein [Nocardioides jishulii]QCX28710.1 hypothetical protein FCL41_15105 [Nocardioides jishulii]TKI64394.1 hypothetical protein FC770_04465 [Nocardioides jishulii]
MSALTSPKGPLPPRVYWFRRALVLVVAFLVVFGTARLLTSSSDAKSDDEDAVATVSKETTEKAGTTESPTATPSASPSASARAKPTKPPLPAPDGVCTNDDVVVTPDVPEKRSGAQLPITLVLTTKTAEACTWQVSSRSVTVKIDSGSRKDPDEIWHSRHCPKAIPTKDVTVYRDHETKVVMAWSGRRSDEECSNLTDWARAGWYHVNAAAYAGEPTSVQFKLARPSPVTVTKTVEPKQQKPKKKKPKKPASSPKPSGAVEPNG